MNRDDAEQFSRSLGKIGGGWWEQVALAKKLGVPKALGLTVEQWVNEHLGGYIKMSREDQREAVNKLTADGHSQREIASTLGIGLGSVNRALVPNGTDEAEKDNEINNADVPNGTPVDTSPLDTVAALAATEQVRNAAKIAETRSANEERRKTDLERPVDVALAPGLHHGDFRRLSDSIADESVQLVFTDPPYDKESVDLYDDAARIARRILRPGGSFITYAGQRHLPSVLTACSRHLVYWWCIAGIHSGGNQILNKLGVRCGRKPLVWFVKNTRGDVQNVLFDIVTGDREKNIHEWQQAEGEASYYIEEVTSPDGLVVDFFVGGGTTAVAAKKLGRRWIGFEISATAAERASKRIEVA